MLLTHPAMLKMAGWAAHWTGRVVGGVRGHRPAALLLRGGDLASAVLCEPLVRAAAWCFPEHELHLCAPEPICQLLSGNPYVHRCLPWDPAGVAPRVAYELGRIRYDAGIWCGGTRFSTFEPVRRLVAAGEWWNTPVDDRDAAGAVPHELYRHAETAQSWGRFIDPLDVRLYISGEAAEAADAHLGRWHAEAERIGAACLAGVAVAGAIGAGWAQAIDRLWQRHRVLCILLNGQSECESELADVPHVRLREAVDPLTLAAIVRRLDLVLGDGGFEAQLAMALKTPAVIATADDGRYLPWPGANNAVIIHAAEDEVDPNQVVAGYLRLLDRAQVRARALREAV